MPAKNERLKSKEILRSQRESTRRNAREAFPASEESLRSLFNYVDARLLETQCDDTLRHTKKFLLAHQIPEEQLLIWLQNAGGYCDCEVIGNAEEAF